MKLYHGTNAEFDFIDLEKCPPKRDYGRGFYLTNIKVHAEQRAQNKVDSEGGVKRVMEFDFDEAMFADPTLRVKRFPEVSEEWALFVMHNRIRKGNEPEHEYDIVEGPVADDDMYLQFRLFGANRIKLRKFVKSLKYREATHQIAFCSERAIEMMLDYNQPPRFKIEEIASNLAVALVQDGDMSEDIAQDVVYNSSVFAQLADPSTGLYLKPWTEIYELLKKEVGMMKKL